MKRNESNGKRREVMKQLLMLATAILALTGLALTQENPSAESGKNESRQAKSEKVMLTGCLTVNDKYGGFQVTTKAGKVIGLKSAKNLREHNGHEVMLEGKWKKSAGDAAGHDTDSAGDTAGHDTDAANKTNDPGTEGGTKGHRVLTVTEIKEISTTCD
jgi:hypothetical protein